MKFYKKYLTTAALIWAGCFVLFFFINMFVLSPQKKTKKQIEKQLAEQKQIYDSALKVTQEETRTQLNTQIEHLQNKLKDFAIDFQDSANLTFDISQIAGEKKVASFSIKPKGRYGVSAIPNCEYLRENHIDVSFTGSFNQFATLLNALERHRPVVFVDIFKMTRSKQGDSGNKVDMELVVFVRNHGTSEEIDD
jgi:Tfp pilus assembly protein PilO